MSSKPTAAQASEQPDSSRLGFYDLSFLAAIVSPEHVRHVDARLTQTHEKIHRDLTFGSTFGFFSFIVATIASSHPDPIFRYRFREMRDLVVGHSVDPQESAAYYIEHLDAELVSAHAPMAVKSAASTREAWAVRWLERAVRPLRLGKALERGFAYLLADLSLGGGILREIGDAEPDPDLLRAYLSQPTQDPNTRFLTFAKAAFFHRWSLRRCVRETLTAFCRKHGLKEEVLQSDVVELDSIMIGRLEYDLDESFRHWLAGRRREYEIVPVGERSAEKEIFLQRWRSQLPEEVQAVLPESAAFVEYREFFARNDAVLVNPPGLTRTYKRIDGLSDIPGDVEEREWCICVLSPTAYPRVKCEFFADGRVPDGFLVVTVSIFNPALPNLFEDTGYAIWSGRRSALQQLKEWNAPRTVVVFQSEDVSERGNFLLGEPRSDFSATVRVLKHDLVNSRVANYLADLGSEALPVRAYVIMSGNDQSVPCLVAKTDEVQKLEYIAPITPTTLRLIQSLEYAPWVQPKRQLSDYEPNPGPIRATVNACERVVRYGFG
jgi:hypothetical protein